MCGIAGYLGPKREGLLDRMIDAIRARGPDGAGEFSDPHIELGHTRLAIIDIAGGAQPMLRENGRYVVSYNGEIYNYESLRAKIEAAGHRFTTSSDNELLPPGYAAFGRGFFSELNGIFAFALYDTLESRLFLVRDHFGIKPLYYADTAEAFVFSSSARAVAMHPDVDRGLAVGAIRDYLQYRYARDGQHFFRGVRTLPPGTILEVTAGGKPRVSTYWQPRLRTGTSAWSADEWINRTETLLEDAI